MVLNELGMHAACHCNGISGRSVCDTESQRMTALKWPTAGWMWELWLYNNKTNIQAPPKLLLGRT